MATKPQISHGQGRAFVAAELEAVREEENQDKLNKMPFKKVFKSECSGEYADSDYQFSWRGKKFNCLHKESKKKDEDRYESGKPPSGYKP